MEDNYWNPECGKLGPRQGRPEFYFSKSQVITTIFLSLMLNLTFAERFYEKYWIFSKHEKKTARVLYSFYQQLKMI